METWLRCKVSPGQFSSEYAVQGEAFDGTGFSLFAPVQTVDLARVPSDGEIVDGWIQVVIEDRKDDLCLVRLPRQVIGYNEYVTVRAEQLESRRSRQEV